MLDFTTRDNVAAFTAATALEQAAPRILRIAGDSVSVRSIAQQIGELECRRYKPLWAGSIGSLGLMIRVAKVLAPQPAAAFPPWQGLQYLRDMFSGRGKLAPLDNGRHPDIHWTSVRQHLEKLAQRQRGDGLREA